jgi:hypothetical protein
MRLALTAVTLCLVAGCSSACSTSADPNSHGGPRPGTATLKILCPEVHLLVDSLVASTPGSQREFLTQVQRLWDASDQHARDTLEGLLDAGKNLEKAGVGPGFYAARDRIHTAVVAVNDECVKLGAPPILHSGPHQVS